MVNCGIVTGLYLAGRNCYLVNLVGADRNLAAVWRRSAGEDSQICSEGGCQHAMSRAVQASAISMFLVLSLNQSQL